MPFQVLISRSDRFLQCNVAHVMDMGFSYRLFTWHFVDFLCHVHLNNQGRFICESLFFLRIDLEVEIQPMNKGIQGLLIQCS